MSCSAHVRSFDRWDQEGCVSDRSTCTDARRGFDTIQAPCITQGRTCRPFHPFAWSFFHGWHPRGPFRSRAWCSHFVGRGSFDHEGDTEPDPSWGCLTQIEASFTSHHHGWTCECIIQTSPREDTRHGTKDGSWIATKEETRHRKRDGYGASTRTSDQVQQEIQTSTRGDHGELQ